MANDDALLAEVRAIMEHARRGNACCTDGDTRSAFAHYAPFGNLNEERVAGAYAVLIDQRVLDLHAVKERENDLKDREHGRG